MHKGVVHDFALEQLELVPTRQLAVEEQVSCLEEVGLFRELLDRVAAVGQSIRGSILINLASSAEIRKNGRGPTGAEGRLLRRR